MRLVTKWNMSFMNPLRMVHTTRKRYIIFTDVCYSWWMAAFKMHTAQWSAEYIAFEYPVRQCGKTQYVRIRSHWAIKMTSLPYTWSTLQCPHRMSTISRFLVLGLARVLQTERKWTRKQIFLWFLFIDFARCDWLQGTQTTLDGCAYLRFLGFASSKCYM